MGQRRHTLTPQRSPAHQWGAELRTWRDHRHFSLAQLASQVFYDASHLGKCERGERRPPRKIAEACDQVLGAGGVLLRLWEQMFGDGHEANSMTHEAKDGHDGAVSSMSMALWDNSMESWEDLTVPARTQEGRTVLVAVSRRHLLAAMGATVGAAATVVPISQALAATGIPPDLHPVEHFQRIRRILADNDNLFGPGRVLATAQEQMAIIQRARLDHRRSDRDGLTAVQVEFSDLIGWLYQDAGRLADAQHWLDRALEWSHIVGEPTTTAFLLARKAQLAGDMGDHVEAIDLAEAAARVAVVPSRFTALASTYGAHGHALRGERSACLRAYDTAHAALSAPEDDPLPWGKFFNRAYIEVRRANSLMVLGDFRAAASTLDTAIQTLPPGFLRDHGVYLAWQALAHANAGEPELAATTGMRALVIGAETGSQRIVAVLNQLARTIAPSRAAEGVEEFHSALIQLLPSATEP